MQSEHVKSGTSVRTASAIVCGLLVSLLSGCASGVAPNPGAQVWAGQISGGSLRAQVMSGRPGSSQYPSTIPMTHVLTWDQLGGVMGTHQISWAQAAPFLTWAMTGSADSVAIRAAGIKTVVYTNPNRQGPGGPMYTNDETTFAHDCSGQRIHAKNLPDHVMMDVTSRNMWSLWRKYIYMLTVRWGGTFDAIYEDAADSIAYANGQPCSFDQIAWTVASNEMNQSTGAPIFYNGLELFSGSGKTLGISPSISLNATTIGGEAEACYTAFHKGQHRPYLYVWQAFENTEIAMYGTGKWFLCGGSNYQPADQAIAERLYQDASFLLTYNPQTSMLSEHFQTPTRFHVEPESELVALEPLRPEPTRIVDLIVYTGVYAREYGACYLQGILVGKCAAVVNSKRSGTFKKFPWPAKYHHTLVLTGGGVLDGGTIATNGPPPPAQLDGEQAVIVFE